MEKKIHKDRVCWIFKRKNKSDISLIDKKKYYFYIGSFFVGVDSVFTLIAEGLFMQFIIFFIGSQSFLSELRLRADFEPIKKCWLLLLLLLLLLSLKQNLCCLSLFSCSLGAFFKKRNFPVSCLGLGIPLEGVICVACGTSWTSFCSPFLLSQRESRAWVKESIHFL